jgi:hypothetical protein
MPTKSARFIAVAWDVAEEEAWAHRMSSSALSPSSAFRA